MVGKKEYRRWEYDDEAEISVEEQLTLEDHEQTDEMMQSSTTFSQPTITMNGSRIHQKRCGKITSINRKVQLLGLSAVVLLIGFIAGWHLSIRYRKESPAVTPRNSKHSSSTPSSSTPWSSHEINESALHKLVGQISAEKIRYNLKRMSQEVHTAGTVEGRAMAMAIRDLWRSYGLSVRVEQHKATLTRTNAFNFIEALDANGSVIYRSSQVADDINLPNARPILAFSPSADLNGTLIYGHFGSFEDFKYLETAQVPLNESIAMVRFGDVHPSVVVATAVMFGIKGLIFYPDPKDFGPMMPSAAIRRSSILTLGQIHEYQEHKSMVIPSHTISSNDAEYLFRRMMNGRKIPKGWQGGLNTLYSLGGVQKTHLRLFNENYPTSIYNVIASIPGAWESDRYVIVGCSHDSWTYGAGDPGVGLAILTEIVRVFATTVQKGWKTRRSILFISWDANLYASSGVSHWLQEHHFEISSRAVAYIDLTRALAGNQTLRVFTSPVLREVTKKAIARIKRFDTMSSSGSGSSSAKSSSGKLENSRLSSVEYSSTVVADEPSFAFLGNIGIPFVKLSFFNSPKGHDYPLFHTSFDTFENFRRLVDPNFNGSETLGRIISTLIVLLVDSSLLPMNVEDYVEEIQKEEVYNDLTAAIKYCTAKIKEYNKVNESRMGLRSCDPVHEILDNVFAWDGEKIIMRPIEESDTAYLQAAVMRLEVIGDNFRTDVTGHNDTLRIIINNEQHEPDAHTSHQVKSKKLLFHRIINDKLMGLDRAFLSRKSDVFKHLVLGYSLKNFPMMCKKDDSSTEVAHENCSYDENYNFHFPKLREALNCGKKYEANIFDQQRRDVNDCRDWKAKASQEVAALIRALDAAAAILQSPLLPEESDSSSA